MATKPSTSEARPGGAPALTDLPDADLPEAINIRALAVPDEEIDLAADERLETIWLPVWVVAGMAADENPKLHDLQALSESFRDYGFSDPPKWDKTLNGGKGGLVFGNGRAECLFRMEETGRPRPRGVALHRDTGRWLMPVKIGLDLESQQQALKFLIDHNNLTLSGGTLTALDASRMFDTEQYLTLLDSVGGALTVDENDIELIRAFHDEPLDLSDEDEDVDENLEPDGADGDGEGQVGYILKFDEIIAQEFEEMLAVLAAKYEVHPSEYGEIIFNAVQFAYRAETGK